MINTQLEHIPLPLKLEVLKALELDNDSDETESDFVDDETTLVISSDEEAELEAQRIRFHELVERNLQMCERKSGTPSTGSSVSINNKSADQEKDGVAIESSNSFKKKSQTQTQTTLRADCEQATRKAKKTPPILSCDQCSKTFTKISRLNDHKRVHTGEKPYECSVCGKQFRIKMRLAEHALRHRKEKAFKCEICGHAVATKQDLKLHQRHHNGDKRYPCTQCPKAFVRGSDLKIHMRIHTGEKPFICEVCQKAFRANQNLIVHRKTHGSEKEFKCDYCDKHFMRNIDRKVHHRTHTGEKPYKCEICNRGYSSRFHVRTHIERDHVQGATRQRRKPGPKPKHLKGELEKQKNLTEECNVQVNERAEEDLTEAQELREKEPLESAAPAHRPFVEVTPEETMHQVSLALKIALEDDNFDGEEVQLLEKENDTPRIAGVPSDGTVLQEKQNTGSTTHKELKITSYFTVVGQKTEF